MFKSLIMVSIMATLASGMNQDSYIYPETGIVVDVNRNANLVTFQTCGGMLYSFTECDDWQEGDMCSVIMYSGDVSNVYDDTVISVKYSGCKEWLPDVYTPELLTAGE